MRRGTIALSFALFLPLAFAQSSNRPATLAAQAASVKGELCHGIKDFAACHKLPSGCTVNKSNDPTQYDAYLAFLKNQKISPADADAIVAHTWTKLTDFTNLDKATQKLNVGDHQAAAASDLANLGQGEIDAVVGYLYFAQQGGVEACNCKLKTLQNVDYHIGIGFDSQLAGKIASGNFVVATGPSSTDKAKQTSIVVEATPHYRASFHKSWKRDALDAQHGKVVKVVGQLLLDNDHNNAADTCSVPHANKSKCWRASAWELHPVTRIFICKDGTACNPASPEDWKEF